MNSEYALGQLVDIKYGKNQKDVVSESGNVPIYGTGGLIGYATKCLYDKPSVLIGRKGTIDKVRYVDHPFWTVDTLFYTVVNEDLVLPKYLYYLLSRIDLSQYDEGTAVPSLRTETLNSIVLSIPTVGEQNEVISLLNPIDDLICINNQINDCLVDLMRTLLKSMMNASVYETKLSDIAEITMGQSPPGTSYNESGDGILFFQGCAEFGHHYPSPRLYTTEPKRMAKSGDTLLSVRAPVGDINVAVHDCCIGRGLASIRHKADFGAFIYYLMDYLHPKFDAYNSAGTVFGSINKDALSNITFELPPEGDISNFNTFAKVVEKEMMTNHCSNQRLIQMRDSLINGLIPTTVLTS